MDGKLAASVVLTWFVTVAATVASTHTGNVIYVDADATGPAQDGSSWCSAFLTLDEALGAASPGTTIRVADGTYVPDTSGLHNRREATYNLVSGVAIFGGYAGCGDGGDSRDVTLYETVLSGDLHGNDEEDFVNNNENLYRVVTAEALDDAVVLDGLTVSSANHNRSWGWNLGGGMYTRYCDVTLNNCTFRNN